MLLGGGVEENISIHAPPRGATALAQRAVDALLISIHAPPRGATPSMNATRRGFLFQFTPLREGRLDIRLLRSRRCYFNSRPSARGDSSAERRAICPCISIHAPPRGATRGCHQPQKSCIFQFTPLREGRPRSVLRVHGGFDFNSRPSARGDWLNAEMDDEEIKISIHAPPRGATVAIG